MATFEPMLEQPPAPAMPKIVGVRQVPLEEEYDKLIEVFVNGKRVFVPRGCNLVEACRRAGFYVPVLCYHPRLPPVGKCGLCNVEIEGNPEPVLGCSTTVQPEMRILTDTQECRRRTEAAMSRVVGKLRSRLPESFPAPEMQRLMSHTTRGAHDVSSSAIKMDLSKCVECGRCVRACRDVQGLGIWKQQEGGVVPISTSSGSQLADTDCVSCGLCASVCPSGAISEVSNLDEVFEALKSGKICVAQIAPSVRVAIGEEFGSEPGAIMTGQLVWALKRAGFHFVFDTNVGADLTVVEEGTEFAGRLTGTNPRPLPMFTSCCPCWVTLLEKQFPHLIPHMSTCKSPQAMIAALIKTHWAESIGKKQEDIYSVSIMPCTAKKDEILRETLSRNGRPDVDYSMTTRECADFLKRAGVTRLDLSMPFDNPLGVCSGAGAIFGATGGVMEAVLRTAADRVAGARQTVPSLEMQQCRGFEGVKTADVQLTGGQRVRVGVVHGIANIRRFISEMERLGGPTKSGYHLVEVMACSCGCVGGGGQPKSADPDIFMKRAKAIYQIDEATEIRRAHENPSIQTLYERWLGEPNGPHSHELLHTHYAPQNVPDRELAARPPAATPVPVDTALPESIIAVMFATVGGNSEGVARRIHGDLVRAKLEAKLWPMDAMEPSEIPKLHVAIVVTSTFGEGEPPSQAKAVVEWLDAQREPERLQNVSFAVFGLGSKKYSRFNEVAKRFDFKFEGLGAKRLVDVGLGDDTAEDGFNTALEPWLQLLYEELGVAPEKVALRPRYRVLIGFEATYPTPPPLGAMYATLLEKRLLTPESYTRPIMLFELDLSETNCHYLVGDSIAIWPENLEDDVERFLKAFGINSSAIVTIEPRESSAPPLPIPSSITITHLFQRYLDIFSQPRKLFFRQLAQFAKDPSERERLLFLSSPEGAVEFTAYLNEHPAHSDVLFDFPSAHPTLDFLVDMVPSIKPRLYSIASSPAAVGERVQLVIGIPTEIVRARGKIRTGLATGWLRGLEAGAQIPVHVHEGTLRPPNDTTAPLLMVGLGTGFAPMRALLQDRLASKHAGKPVGPATLYQACRYSEADFVCQDELAEFKREGVLTKHIGVFSHQDPSRFMTVDLAISEDSQPAWDSLSKSGTHYFFCGPAAYNIPAKIESALVQAVAAADDLGQKGSKSLVQKMKAEGRWLVEAF